MLPIDGASPSGCPDPFLREPFNRNVFNIRASYFDETEKIAEHLTTVGVTKIAVLY